MTLQEQLCHAFCDASLVREVPMGHAIRSPFRWFTGDSLIFYARTEGNNVRFEDSGSTIFDLEAAGIDMSTSSRLESLADLAEQHGVMFDEEQSLFRSEWVPAERAGVEGIRFLSFMNRVQDLLFTSWERTANTFKEDLLKALEGAAGGDLVVEAGVAPVPSIAYYTVDIVVRHKDSGRVAAVFPATSEQKALEAILFSKELELHHVSDVVPFLVFETTPAGKIHGNTLAKAMNSSLLMASWDGGHVDVVEKVLKQVAGVLPAPN